MKNSASKLFFGLSLIAFSTMNAQQKTIVSNQIKKIDTYLNTAPPSQYASKGTAVKKTTTVSKVSSPDYFGEAEEYNRLTAETAAAHKDKTVKLLNAMFDQDPNSKEAILMVQNQSDCNMIVRIQGDKNYNLTVPAHGENSIVLKKASYQLKSNVCDAQYASTKDLRKGMVVTLNRTASPAAINLALNKK